VGPVFNIEGKRAKIQMDSSRTVAIRLKRAPPTSSPRRTNTPFPTATPVPSATQSPTTTTTPLDIGGWDIVITTDPIDDKVSTIARIEAIKGKGALGEPVALFLGCGKGNYGVIIEWGAFLGDDQMSVTYRFDDYPAMDRQWDAGKTATYYSYNPRANATFIKQLIYVDRFVAKVTPFDESPITAIFDLNGISVIGPQILEACR
jgi:type VI secretion system protein VasI